MEHLHRVWKYPNESKITQNGPQYMTEQLVSMWQKAKGVPGIEAVTRGRGGGWVSEGLKIFSSGPLKIYFKGG